MIPILFWTNSQYVVVVCKHIDGRCYDCRWWDDERFKDNPNIFIADVDIAEEKRFFNSLAEAREFMKEVLNRQ